MEDGGGTGGEGCGPGGAQVWRLAWGRGASLGFLPPLPTCSLSPWVLLPAPPRQQEGKGELASEGPHKASSPPLLLQPWHLAGLVQPELEILHKGRGPKD